MADIVLTPGSAYLDIRPSKPRVAVGNYIIRPGTGQSPLQIYTLRQLQFLPGQNPPFVWFSPLITTTSYLEIRPSVTTPILFVGRASKLRARVVT